jgi:hypothetical protein
MKTERVSLQNKHVGIQQYTTANKTKQNWKQKELMLQEQHIAYEARGGATV